MSSEENPGSSQSTVTAPALQEENPGASQKTGMLSAQREEALDSYQADETPKMLRAETRDSVPTAGAASEKPEEILHTSENSRIVIGLGEESPISSMNTDAVPELQIELPALNPETPESAEIDTMLADMEALVAVPQGKVVRGTVVKVTETEVRLNVGTGLEGAVPISEFLDSKGEMTVAPGDEVGVWVERYNEKHGTVAVSRLKAARLEIWDAIERAFREQKAIPGRVIGRIKGGLMVDVGVHAFMPSSQAALRPLRNVDSLLGQDITCKIIKLIRKRSNIVVSRKLVLEEEANHLKVALLERLTEGVEVTGCVKNLTDFGAFIDLGGMDGLLHVTDMSWGRVVRPSEVVQVGQELNVKVLKFDPEKGRISLGLKQLLPDPWERVPSTYHVGDRITGRVANVTDFGAFIELEPGIEGLVHVSELGWSTRPKHPSKMVKPGDQTDVAVLDVNQAQRRISLSIKQTLPDPWNTLIEKYPAGSVVEATVTSLTDFGAFVEIDSDIEGLIHNTDLTWAKKVRHPSELLKKGENIKAVVLRLDAAHRRLSLGMRQLQPDPWDGFLSRIRVGDMVKAKVSHMAPFGAFVEIESGIEALCHTSEIGDSHSAAGKGQLDVGSELEFRVIRLDPIERKISLSLKPVVAPPPAPARSVKKTETAFRGSGPVGSQESKRSGPPPEPKKKAEPLTTMGEALSAAGITSAARTMREPAPSKASKKPRATSEYPAPAASPVKVEPGTATTDRETMPSPPAVKAEGESAATGDEFARPEGAAPAEVVSPAQETGVTAEEPGPALKAEQDTTTHENEAARPKPAPASPAIKAEQEYAATAQEPVPAVKARQKTAGDGEDSLV